MRYISTRGEVESLSFEDALLAGLATDGGLYVPAEWPKLDTATLAGFAGAPYGEVARHCSPLWAMMCLAARWC